jgi:acyl-CoA dehydrogenase
MGKTDPEGAPHRQQSMVLVPRDTPGLEIIRHLPVFGYQDQHGHSELRFTDVRVPVTNILSGEGDGFSIAQARLGPGRIHHCMRAIGMAERALELMCARVVSRTAFGKTIAEQGVVREWIGESRLAIDQARFLVLNAAWLIDTVGVKNARTEIASIKVAAPRAALFVVEKAVQAYGAAGVSGDTPLAEMWAQLRTLRLADGPDEVHLRSVAREALHTLTS